MDRWGSDLNAWQDFLNLAKWFSLIWMIGSLDDWAKSLEMFDDLGVNLRECVFGPQGNMVKTVGDDCFNWFKQVSKGVFLWV